METIKVKNRYSLLQTALFAALFLLVACGGDDNSNIENPSDNEEDVSNVSAETPEDLPNCTEKREGETALVKEDSATYKCESGRWVFESAPVKTVETLDDLSNCTSKIYGDTVKIMSESAIYRCYAGIWQKYRSIIDTLITVDELLACVSKRAGDSAFIAEEHALYRCEDDSWEKIISFMDTISMKNALPNCTEKKNGDSVYVEKEEAVYLCIDNVWEYLGEVFEKEDELPGCTENRDGKKVFIRLDRETRGCLNGRWARFDITKEKKCASGLNEDCLVGKWNLQSIQTIDGSLVYTDFGASPSTLEFSDGGKFHFIFTTDLSKSEMAGNGCGGSNAFGSWEIINKTLKLKIGITDCLTTGETFSLTPTINDRSLNFNMVVFHTNDITDALMKANSTEYYIRAGDFVRSCEIDKTCDAFP